MIVLHTCCVSHFFVTWSSYAFFLKGCIISHLFNKYLLSGGCVPGRVLQMNGQELDAAPVCLEFLISRKISR